MAPGIFRELIALSAILLASVCLAQAPQSEVVPLKVGGVDVAFGLEADEVGVVPQAEGATAYVQAVMGKQTRFTQCFFVLDAAYRKKLLSGQPTTEAEDRKGLRSMIVVTTQPCDEAFLKTIRDGSLASTKDKRALVELLKDVQSQATKDGGATIAPLKDSPAQAAMKIGAVGLISESSRHFTIGVGADDGIVISTFMFAESRLVVFSQWTDQRNFPHCIERAKAFVDTLDGHTKAAR